VKKYFYSKSTILTRIVHTKSHCEPTLLFLSLRARRRRAKQSLKDR